MSQNKLPTEPLNSRKLYMNLINSYQVIAKYFGFDIYREDFNITGRLIAACGWTSFAIIYMSYLFVIKIKGDPGEFFISIVFFGCCIQQVAKVWNIMVNRSNIKECHQIVLDLTASSRGEPEEILSKLNKFYMIFGTSIFVMNVGACIILSIYPLYTYIQFGRRDYIVALLMPFIDDETNVGHGINLFAQFLQAMNTAIQYAFTDSIFFYYLFFAGAYEELVEHDCRTLSKAILESENIHDRYSNRRIQQKLHTLLLNLIKRTQKLDELDLEDIPKIEIINKKIEFHSYFEKLRFFERDLMVQFGCLSYSLMLSLLIIKFTEWFAIYPFTFVIIFLISMFSIIGTYIEMKFDRFPMVIYDIPWHRLTPSDQKMFMVLLQHSQSSKRLNILGKKTLNVQTGISIFKFIYSAYVMLDSFY